MKNLKKYKKHHEEVSELAEMIGIKLAPLEAVLASFPDSYMGMEFDDEEASGAKNARAKYSEETQKKLIEAFRSHDWLVSSDIYGHNGLSKGGSCQSCKRRFSFPKSESNAPDRKKQFNRVSDDFILAYHYVYGRHKRFGGRIKKCGGK